MKTAAQMMRDYREARGITQTHVGKRTGIDSRRISQFETGLIRLPADDFLKIIVDGFGTTPQFFLTINSRKTSKNTISTHYMRTH